MTKKLKIGLFGFGCVGQGFYEIFTKKAIAGAEIGYICVREKGKKRPLPEHRFTFDKSVVLNDPEIAIIVELISDAEEAYEIVKGALERGKKVVSANKKMIAHHLPELVRLQSQYNGTLIYEASCCGSVPVIRTLEDFFAFEEVEHIKGIFNGSSNFILSKISEEGLPYTQALEQAQRLGFAEADPTLDVGGLDALNKLCIVVYHALGVYLHPGQILHLGIQHLKSEDNAYATENKWKLKQIAFAAISSQENLYAWVLPQFVEEHEELYNIDQEFNGVNLKASFAGTQLLKGKGAGAHPTGAAVYSDVKAMIQGYGYKYAKVNTTVVLSNEVVLKVYASSDNEALLDELGFIAISEKGTVQNSHYLIGDIGISALKNASAFVEESNIFIAALPESAQDFSRRAKGNQNAIAGSKFTAAF